METFTLRISEDRSIYFVEPKKGQNARGFWLGVEKLEYPVPVETIKNPYSGAFAFDGYWRQWFSMRGFVVRQGAPQSGVPAGAEVVRDYFAAAHLVTREEALHMAQLDADGAAAAAREAEEADAAAADAWFEQYADEVARHHAEQAGRSEKPVSDERAEGNEKTVSSERAATSEKPETVERDPEAAPGVSSGGRPHRSHKR